MTNTETRSPDASGTSADRFVRFHYPEMKDLAKQMLTLIAGTLVLTVSLADKIVPLGTASPAVKILMASCWASLSLAFILGGIGLTLVFFAAVAATEGAVYGRTVAYRRLAKPAFIVIDASAVLFALGLTLLAIAGTTRLVTG